MTLFRSLTRVLVLALVLVPAFLHAATPQGSTPGSPQGSTPGTPQGSTPGIPQGTTPGGPTRLTNPLNVDSLPELLNAILKAVIQLGSIFLVLMLVFVGFKFVMAQGNEEELRSARSALMWTVIGGLLLLGAQAISLVIENTVQNLTV